MMQSSMTGSGGRALMLPAHASKVLRVFSYGGGVQSNAVLVLQAQRQIIPYDVFIFANVGADSENPETLEYIERYAKPFAEAHGIRFVEVAKKRRGGETETLMQFIERTPKSVPIPAYQSGGKPLGRSCTDTFKISVIDQWIKKQSYTHAITGLGISLDEFFRVKDTRWHDKVGNGKKPRKLGFWKRLDYPLIDSRLSRFECVDLVGRAGLPVPPKSSCFFCPYTRSGEWIELKRNKPELFQKAVELENLLSSKRNGAKSDNVYLHRDLVPLEQAVGNQLRLFTDEEMDFCESGYCAA